MAEPTTRLFLITPVLTEAEPFGSRLNEALSAGDVACVLIRHAARDERSAKALLRELVGLVQGHGAAALVENDPRLAAHLDADGVHLNGADEDLADALESMKPERIVGCGGLALRDDAMTAGERDIDYLLFGDAERDGSLPDPAWTLERVQWWAEIFNVPCVGLAQSLDQVGPLTRARADFVGIAEAVWTDARGPAAAVAEALAQIEAFTPVEDVAS